jgi:hypothetical protein
MAQKIWTPQHAEALQRALTASGADVAAVTAALLLGKSHMANLLGAHNNAFYNEGIRYAAGVKALKALGYSDSQIQGLVAAEPVTESAPPQATLEAPVRPPLPTQSALQPTAHSTAHSTAEPVAQHTAEERAQQTAPQDSTSAVSPAPSPAYHWYAVAALVLGGVGYGAYQSMLLPKAELAPTTNTAEQTPLPASTAPAPATEPAPVVATVTATATPSSTAATSDAQTAASVPDESNVICDFSQATTAQEAVKSVPNAPKGYVHFVATENDTLLCVKDRNGVMSKVRLQAKSSRSIYGDEPLTVNFSKVNKPTVYYQRNKIYLREDTVRASFE